MPEQLLIQCWCCSVLMRRAILSPALLPPPPRQFDMQRITLEELKHVLFYAFRDHLTMKDIENIIINEEESLKENSGNCQTEFEGGECTRTHTHTHTHTGTQLIYLI